MADNLARLNQVIQNTATTSSRGDFLITHAPFTKLLERATSKYLTEEELYREALLSNLDEHKLIMILGGAGSGKSHLIRWLAERYKEDADETHEAILWITKAHNTLQDTLTQLLESKYFSDDVRENTLKRIQSTRGKYSDEEFKRIMAHHFQYLTESDKNDTVLQPQIRAELSCFLKNDYIIENYLMLKNGPLDRLRARLDNSKDNSVADVETPIFSSADFTMTLVEINHELKRRDNMADARTIRLAERLASRESGSRTRDTIVSYLNTKVSAVVNRSFDLQTVDFRGLFLDLRKQLKQQETNLTIFIEDINSCTGIEEDLVDALLASNKDNPELCRMISIVGSTSWFYENKLTLFAQQRIKHCIYLPENALIDEKNIAKFAARYINATRLEESEVNEWATHNPTPDSVPIAAEQHNFAIVDVDGRPYSIFPFNERALSRLYNTLPQGNEQESSRTPRVFLTSVLQQILTSWYTQGADFLNNTANFQGLLFSLPPWTEYVYESSNNEIGSEYATQREIILRLWGDGTTNRVGNTIGGVSKEIFDAFGIPFPVSIAEVDATPQLQTKVVPQPEVESKPQPKRKTNPNINKYLNDIDAWAGDKKADLILNADLRDMLVTLVQQYFPWEMYEIPYSLVEARITKRNFCIEGQSSAIPDNSLVLPRNEEIRSLLTALTYWRYSGERSWEFENGLDYFTIAMSWLERYSQKIIDFVIKNRDVKSINDYNKYAVSAAYFMSSLSHPIDITKDLPSVANSIFSTTDNSTNYEKYHSDEWENLRRGLNEISEKLVQDGLSLFCKSVGGKRVEAANYTFVDATKLLSCIEELKDAKWEPPVLQGNYKETQDDTKKYMRAIVAVSEAYGRLISAEFNRCKSYIKFFNDELDGRISKDGISETFESMKEYLSFLNSMKKYYSNTSFAQLDDEDSVVRLYDAINTLKALIDINQREVLFSKLSANPFIEPMNYYVMFSNFSKLINTVNTQFASSGDSAKEQEIISYTRTAQATLNNLNISCTILGGNKLI